MRLPEAVPPGPLARRLRRVAAAAQDSEVRLVVGRAAVAQLDDVIDVESHVARTARLTGMAGARARIVPGSRPGW